MQLVARIERSEMRGDIVTGNAAPGFSLRSTRATALSCQHGVRFVFHNGLSITAIIARDSAERMAPPGFGPASR